MPPYLPSINMGDLTISSMVLKEQKILSNVQYFSFGGCGGPARNLRCKNGGLESIFSMIVSLK